MNQPHDNWATYYDFVFEETFGEFYQNLTTETLSAIKHIIPKGQIIDFGAGTGRLSIPLTQEGYDITAVEKSSGMVLEILRKLREYNFNIKIHNCSISEYKNGKADLAIALFTVLSYSTTEEELSINIKNICNHINENGYLFFDLPGTVFFDERRRPNIKTNSITRSITLEGNHDNNIFTYKEKCSGIYNGQNFSYKDDFKIRYWELSTVDKLLHEYGFTDTMKTFPQFSSTGSTYKLYKRP